MSSKDCVIVIDMQNDFVETGAPCCVKGASATVPAIVSFVKRALEEDVEVFFVIRGHKQDGSDAESFRKHLYSKDVGGVCVFGTHGFELVDELKDVYEQAVLAGKPVKTVIKKRFSGFYGTELDEMMKKHVGGTVYITGTQIPNCVRATAIDAMERDFDVVVVSDCCSAQTKQVEESNYYDLMNMGIRVIPSCDLSFSHV